MNIIKLLTYFILMLNLCKIIPIVLGLSALLASIVGMPIYYTQHVYSPATNSSTYLGYHTIDWCRNLSSCSNETFICQKGTDFCTDYGKSCFAPLSCNLTYSNFSACRNGSEMCKYKNDDIYNCTYNDKIFIYMKKCELRYFNRAYPNNLVDENKSINNNVILTSIIITLSVIILTFNIVLPTMISKEYKIPRMNDDAEYQIAYKTHEGLIIFSVIFRIFNLITGYIAYSLLEYKVIHFMIFWSILSLICFGIILGIITMLTFEAISSENILYLRSLLLLFSPSMVYLFFTLYGFFFYSYDWSFELYIFVTYIFSMYIASAILPIIFMWIALIILSCLSKPLDLTIELNRVTIN
jgi:hypothetical protein